jgi:hypothetical protein
MKETPEHGSESPVEDPETAEFLWDQSQQQVIFRPACAGTKEAPSETKKKIISPCH